MRCALPCLLLSFVGCAARCPDPQAQRPSPVIGIALESVRWTAAPPNLPPGAEVAVLEGDPRRPDLFTMRVRMPANYRLGLHTHARDERVTVLDGSVHVALHASGQSTRYGAGSYYVNPAGLPHSIWTDTGAILQITTLGPWTLEYVEQGKAAP